MDVNEEVDNSPDENARRVDETGAEDEAATGRNAGQPNENSVRDEQLPLSASEDEEDEDILTFFNVDHLLPRPEDEETLSDMSSVDAFQIASDLNHELNAPFAHDESSLAIDADEIVSREIHFDTNLPAEHSYLGANMDRVSGVEYMETGREHRLMLFLHQHIVYPGEVIPFMMHTILNDEEIDATNGLLFGVAFPHVRCPKTDAMYGVTCQIYEKGSDGRGNTLIKSRALQRFITTNDTRREHLEYITAAPELKTFGHIKILPEIYLPDPLSSINLGSMNRFRDLPQMENHIRIFQASTTVWPKYVFNRYNINTMIEKVLKSLVAYKVETMPTDPVRLSFWLSRNSHFSEEQLKNIFTTDSVNLRLRIIADSFNDGGIFVCRFCRNQIAYCRDLFAMSKHGVQSQYCNSAGYIHETNTVYKIFNNSVSFSGEPSSEFSWFPGYEWHIIVCRMCNRHIGWQFRANVPNLTPFLFYGIAGASVRIDRDNKRRTLRDHLFPNLIRLSDL